MNRKKILEQILKLISSGELPQVLYDKYLSDTPIGFMSFDELEKYFDYNKPTEQEILKKFEDLGYEILICPTNIFRIQIAKEEDDTIIEIDKMGQWYECRQHGVNRPQCIVLKEHQLLHELFTVYGWFDE